MDNKLIIPALMVSLALVAATVNAQHHEHEEEMSASKAVEVGNKICPVSGEAIGAMGEGVQVEHEGKLYNLCCSMCAKDFKKDPKKYIEKINEKLEKSDHDHEGHDH